MTEQLGLPGVAERDAALARVAEGATETETDLARRALWNVIRRGDEFTADDVWAEIGRLAPGFEIREPRLLGAIVRRAATAGEIVRTDRVRESIRPEHHRYPCRVWIPSAKHRRRP